MTERRPGRPRSQASHQAVLDAAVAVLDERGLEVFTVDEVARRSGVSKATIYKHWPNGLAIAVEAYGAALTEAVPVVETGDVVADLSGQLRRLAAAYATPRGRVIAQLLAAGTRKEDGAALLRQRFFAARRDATEALIARGVASGQLRADIDVELAVDMLFGAVVFRLFNGREPVDGSGAAALAAMAMRGLANE